MSNWNLNYSNSDEWEWYHSEHDGHYLLVAQAAPDRDEGWYVLPYVGALSPDDHRYRGPDRNGFECIHEAQKWADAYLAGHPDGHNLGELDADQQTYDHESGTSTPI